MIKRLLLFIVPFLAVQALPAQDEPSPQNRMSLMQQRHEKLKKKWEAQFRAADLDHSNSLNRAEAQKAGLPAAILDHFDDIDTDHDGQLTPDELMAVYEKRLDAQRNADRASASPGDQ